MYNKKTKIVCTLGPASDSVTEISKLIAAGMNVARLNFSHGTYAHHLQLIENIHRAEKLSGKTIGILQDLQGPKIRLGKLPEPGIKMKKGEIFILTGKKITGHQSKEKTIVPIQYQKLISNLKSGEQILLNDGLIEAKVISISNKNAKCKMLNGGVLRSHMGISFPKSKITLPAITVKDRNDLKFGLKNDVDYIALSFVKSQKDIQQLRDLIKKSHKNTKIIAKIERHEAIENLEEIIKTADAIMVARGDLGIDIPAEEVPLIQKRIIHLSNKYNKPVITATEVLLSMVTNPRATRAEISDAANAILDRTDAIMLSNESAVGKYSTKATATLSKVAVRVEAELKTNSSIFSQISNFRNNELTSIKAIEACDLSSKTKADFLIVKSADGLLAREVATQRIFTPIIIFTETEKIKRELTLVWGINRVQTSKKIKESEIIHLLKKEKILKKRSRIVIVSDDKNTTVISKIIL